MRLSHNINYVILLYIRKLYFVSASMVFSYYLKTYENPKRFKVKLTS